MVHPRIVTLCQTHNKSTTTLLCPTATRRRARPDRVDTQRDALSLGPKSNGLATVAVLAGRRFTVRSMKVQLPLPAGHEAGFRDSLRTLAKFVVDDVPDKPNVVSVEPGEGSGVVTRYFSAHRIADASTDLSRPALWERLFANPPWDAKPDVELTPQEQQRLTAIQSSDKINDVFQRLGTAAARAKADEMPALFQRELPHLFARYPQGTLWYIGVDQRLVRRLAFMRVRLQLTLTPDIDYDPAKRDRVQYFGMHTLSGGSAFGKVFDPLLLAVPPSAMGIAISVFPQAFVFLFGEFEDLRSGGPVGLSARFLPGISTARGVPGMKFPVQNLPTAQLESLLQWWTGRLNVLYSYVADPTNFADGDGAHDVAAQAAWFFTLERMMADAAVLLAAVDAAPLLRMHAAFDLLDKADSLLTRAGKQADATNFKRLLRKDDALRRLDRAFDKVPVQPRPRFKEWAASSYERRYADIKRTTMTSRRKPEGEPDGVLVALNDPARPVMRSWDEYVANLMRAARNSSHGLQDMLRPPPPGSSKPDPRLLLATNSGEVPYSFYEVGRHRVLWPHGRC